MASGSDGQDRRLEKDEQEELLTTLKERFDAHTERHEGLDWTDVRARLDERLDKLRTLAEPERTGGEPDVISRDPDSGEFVFVDCAAESPEGRRSICYDRAGWEARKKHRPETSAVEMAQAMGAELMNEREYGALQAFGPVDTKTSSWLRTPAGVRELGGAIFGDYRFGRVFIYHNGAQSYYGVRGFRCVLRV